MSGETPTEIVLLTAEVVEYFAPHVNGGGGHKLHGALLEGNLPAFVKPGSDAPKVEMARNERAAWVIARALGWDDLLPCVVLRDLHNPFTGSDETSAVIVSWPAGAEHWPDLSRYSDDDVWRAALFDYLVEQSDRHKNNWMGFAMEGRYRLLLIDHGYAFRTDGRQLHSEFVDARCGQPIPEPYVKDLEAVGDSLYASLVPLIGSERAGRVRDRVGVLVSQRVLPA